MRDKIFLKLSEAFDKIIAKITSGRFILTVIGGGVFAYSAYAKIMPPEAISAIVTAIFMSYFQRSDRNGN